MSKATTLADRVRSGGSSQVQSWLTGAAPRNRLIRCAFILVMPWLTTCDSLWTQFREPNPINCLANPGSCAEGQVCNSQTRLCAVPELRLVAGGLGGPGNADDVGEAARFNQPFGVASDGAGNLYVTDFYNHTIRRIVLGTGAVTTIAGMAGIRGGADGIGAAARFNQPSGVTTDRAENLYVADYANCTVRRIDLNTGAVTTIAGTAGKCDKGDGTGADARFNGPSGVTTDAAGNLYVADFVNHAIRKVVLSGGTGTVTTFAGMAGMSGGANGYGTAAQFYRPSGVVADSTGNLYVADTYSHTIRKIALSSGLVTTIAGTASVEGSKDGTGATALFSRPVGIAINGDGNLYVTEELSHTIRRIALNTDEVSTTAGTAGMLGSTDGTGASARFNLPLGIAVESTGNLYVADYLNHTIRKVTLSTGAVSTIAGTAPTKGGVDGTGASARFHNPCDLATDASGNLYVAECSNHTIRRIIPSTGEVTTIVGRTAMNGSIDGVGGDARFTGPFSVAADGAGNLYIADYGNHTIRKVALNTQEVTTIAGKAGVSGSTNDIGVFARFYGPNGVATDAGGNLYVAEYLNHTIRRIVLSTGAVTTIAGTAGASGSSDGVGAAARFNGPATVLADGVGNLYVSDWDNHTIRKVVLSTGAVTTIAGAAGMSGSADGTGDVARFNYPSELATDVVGNLYVADSGNHTIRKIAIPNALVTTIAGIPGQGGVKLGMLPARINAPYGLAVLPTGEVYIGDGGDNAILALR